MATDTSVPPAATHRESGRDRLLAAANDLFYAEGIQSVGVDRIIEHAGVAKATLYNNFAGKEELVQAYLLSREERTTDRITSAIASVDDPRAKLLAPFDEQAVRFRLPGFNGCAFASAATEEPSGGLVDQAVTEFRGRVRSIFIGLARQAGAPDPETLGRQLHVLYDGAAQTARMDHDPEIAVATRSAAEAIVERAFG